MEIHPHCSPSSPLHDPLLGGGRTSKDSHGPLMTSMTGSQDTGSSFRKSSNATRFTVSSSQFGSFLSQFCAVSSRTTFPNVDHDVSDAARERTSSTSTHPRVDRGDRLSSTSQSLLRHLTTHVSAILFSVAMIVPTCISYALAQSQAGEKYFTPPQQQQLFEQIFHQTLWSALLGTCLIPVFSIFRTTANVDTVAAVLLAPITASFLEWKGFRPAVEELESSLVGGASGRAVVSDSAVAGVTRSILWLNAVLAWCFGMSLWLVSKGRLLYYLRFLPFPVIAGFLGGVGLQ